MSTLEGKEVETPTRKNAPRHAKAYQTSGARNGPSSFETRHEEKRVSKKESSHDVNQGASREAT